MSTIVFNMDCMEGMKQYPDKYFDLAIVDPPYGAGLGEGGGGKGWFAKYWDSENLEVSGGGNTKYWNRFGQRIDRYKQDQPERIPRETIQSGFTTKEQTPSGMGNGYSQSGRNTKTKKSFRGMCRLNRSILKNCFASHVIRLYGGGTIFLYHLQDVS